VTPASYDEGSNICQALRIGVPIRWNALFSLLRQSDISPSPLKAGGGMRTGIRIVVQRTESSLTSVRAVTLKRSHASTSNISLSACSQRPSCQVPSAGGGGPYSSSARGGFGAAGMASDGTPRRVPRTQRVYRMTQREFGALLPSSTPESRLLGVLRCLLVDTVGSGIIGPPRHRMPLNSSDDSKKSSRSR
jgi:hypothetical protein